MKKAITIALFTAIILETAACAGAETSNPNETSGKGDPTSQVQSETADPNADSLPDNLDFSNAVIKVLGRRSRRIRNGSGHSEHNRPYDLRFGHKVHIPR